MTDAPDPLGKRALFWAPGPIADDESPLRTRQGDARGKHALYSATDPQRDEHDGNPVPRPRGILPPVSVHCSSCGERRELDVTRFATLHVPFFLWRPGRGFTRFMTCPACGRRAWLSASWTPWSAR
ncbi:MAG: hypothetical protein ACYDD4_02230 [Acidimicrobiales bacterium]